MFHTNRASPGLAAHGLSAGALPSALIRNTFPPRLSRSCGLVPTPASPVVTHSFASGPKSSRQPL